MVNKQTCEHHHHYWALISLLALALVCCFVIIWLWPSNINSSPITKIIRPKAVPVQDLWQKFSNEQYNYNLTIPASWPIKVNDARQVTFGNVPFETGSGWLTLSVASDTSIADWVQENYRSETASSSNDLQDSADLKSPTGLEAKVYTRNLSSSSLENFVIFEHAQKLYVFNYITSDEKFNNEVLQILNSLAFTD